MSNEPLRYGQIIGILAREKARFEADHFRSTVINYCESPIEKIMAAHLLLLDGIPDFSGVVFYNTVCNDRINISFKECIHFVYEYENYQARYFIFQQIPIDQYRVDFLIGCRRPIMPRNQNEILKWDIQLFVVECDGHDFHEKTKEQALRDKKRDRDIQRRGMSILRFSGSEIFNKTITCINEIANHLANLSVTYSPIRDDDVELLDEAREDPLIWEIVDQDPEDDETKYQ